MKRAQKEREDNRDSAEKGLGSPDLDVGHLHGRVGGQEERQEYGIARREIRAGLRRLGAQRLQGVRVPVRRLKAATKYLAASARTGSETSDAS